MSFGCPKEIELYRKHINGYPRGDRTNGAFLFPDKLMVIIANGMGWEHVSVSRKNKIPSYEDMDRVKDIFWGEEDCVMQLHVPKADHVNCHPNVLHLWRPIGKEIPRPPALMVGPES